MKSRACAASAPPRQGSDPKPVDDRGEEARRAARLRGQPRRRRSPRASRSAAALAPGCAPSEPGPAIRSRRRRKRSPSHRSARRRRWGRPSFEPPPFRPLNRAGPMPLQVGSRRTVEEGPGVRPSVLRTHPRESGSRLRRCARMVTTVGSSSTCGPRVSSQPTPCWAELPRCSASVKKLACEPAAGYDRPAAVDELELVLAPVGAFGPLMLAVADSDRRLVEGLLASSVEHELDQPQSPRGGCSSRCRHRRTSTGARAVPGETNRWPRAHTAGALPALMRGPSVRSRIRIEGVAGEVQVVLEAFDGSSSDGPIFTRSPRFHGPRERPSALRRARRRRSARKARPGRIRPTARRAAPAQALGERRLIGQVGRRGRAPAQGEHGHQRQEREATLPRAPVTPAVRLGEHR